MPNSKDILTYLLALCIAVTVVLTGERNTAREQVNASMRSTDSDISAAEAEHALMARHYQRHAVDAEPL